LLALTLGIALLISPASADDQISMTSQPDQVAIFLNDIAFARDTVLLPGGVAVQIMLPARIFPDTLILREGGNRIHDYRLTRTADQVRVAWQSNAATDVREITLEYLLGGVTWKPKYEMWLGDNSAETVEFDFFAEIQNTALIMEDVDTILVAGRVDSSQQLSAVSSATFNQIAVGNQEPVFTDAPTGPADIQHVYHIGDISAHSGDIVYTGLSESTLPARRTLIWNAQSDQQITVIYKVLNQSDQPFAEGIVRSYQDDLFIGSDFIETTPVGGEGSVTVGGLQDVRVSRAERRNAISGPRDLDTAHEVDLQITNFSEQTVDLDVIDAWRSDAEDFRFSQQPERFGDNLFRWTVAVLPGESLLITYEFKT
jgi:hypothetical protein